MPPNSPEARGHQSDRINRGSPSSPTGPFRFTRNPIYLASLGLYLGATLLLNALWPLALLPIMVAVLEWGWSGGRSVTWRPSSVRRTMNTGNEATLVLIS